MQFFTLYLYQAPLVLQIFPKGEKPHGLVFCLVAVAALLLVLAVHELGHLVAGLLQGFRFQLFVVGPLGVTRSGDKIVVYFNRNLGYMGGVAATTPVTDDPQNQRKFALTVAAGPIASFLLAATGLLLFNLLPPGIGRGFWLLVTACSAGICLATTLPTKTGMFFTDRARFFRLLDRGDTGKREAAMLSLMAIYTRDNSCRHIDPEKARLLQDDPEPSMRFWGLYYEYYFYKENLREDAAAESRARLLDAKSAVPATLWKALNIE
ncbi:site-2 protease family protein [Hufsiella ginkgonis]|uniref:Peptidase M50 domain-containing protein n=1 Tax=Hufsiella ginkgonis TaxID=2695274 RepID=A0A7K1XTE9_9SPHI|nr:site-2 protease family protein [Hufsiella ginkgonis]MXV14087.1 hypothetical protein [Hufsiella ginkgonis]